MIAALTERASKQPPPADAAAVSETAKFLHACNLTFEKGILSHAFVRSVDSKVLTNVKNGWQYFTEWAEEHHNTGTVVNMCTTYHTCFSTFKCNLFTTEHQRALGACFKGDSAFEVELEFRNVGI